MISNDQITRVHTLVIGAGQAGLSTAYYLKQRGIPFLLIDAHPRIGDAWRNRWDSLKLFTPARYASLPGFPFKGDGSRFLTKDEAADWLEAYATRFQFPIQTGVRIQRLYREAGTFVAVAGAQRFEAEHVIIAMGKEQTPRIPSFALDLDRSIRQIHSYQYRNPSQLLPGRVLVVGVGNSGADIAMEVSRTHPTFLSGKESGHFPFPLESALSRVVISRVVAFVLHRVLTLSTPMGRKARPKLLRQTMPLMRVRPIDLEQAGVGRLPHITGAFHGQVTLPNGLSHSTENIIWCTGFDHGLDWVDLPIFDQEGDVAQNRGVSVTVPGLFFVGQHFQYALSSGSMVGVKRDAEFVVSTLARRARIKSALFPKASSF